MYKEKINWWYFLFVAGLFIPLSGYAIHNHFILLPYFNTLFIAGINPYLASIFNFIIVFFICVLFKLLYKTRLPKKVIQISYIGFGAVIIFSLLYWQFFSIVHFPEGVYPRRYIDLEPKTKPTADRVAVLNGLRIFKICFFIFLSFINFPKRMNSAVI